MRPISLRRRRMTLLRLWSGLSAQARGVPGRCLLRGARALPSGRVSLSALLLPVALLELLLVLLLPLLR